MMHQASCLNSPGRRLHGKTIWLDGFRLDYYGVRINIISLFCLHRVVQLVSYAVLLGCAGDSLMVTIIQHKLKIAPEDAGIRINVILLPVEEHLPIQQFVASHSHLRIWIGSSGPNEEHRLLTAVADLSSNFL